MNATTYNDSLSLTGLRWCARVSALAVAGVIAFVGVAQGFDPAGMQPKELVLAFCLGFAWMGLLLGWRWEGLGGAMVLVGVASFYLSHFALTGFGSFPRGWAFAAIAVPGLLFLVSQLWQSKTS